MREQPGNLVKHSRGLAPGLGLARKEDHQCRHKQQQGGGEVGRGPAGKARDQQHALAADQDAGELARGHESVGAAALVRGQDVDGQRVGAHVLGRGKEIVDEQQDAEEEEMPRRIGHRQGK